MARVLVLHGPNLNLLGRREAHIYGTATLEDVERELRVVARELGLEIETAQSNHEGTLIDRLQTAPARCAAVVINPGGLTHSSVALRDTVAAIGIPVVEVHMTNIHAREPFRQHSMIAGAAAGQVAGFGVQSYLLGLRAAAALASQSAAAPSGGPRAAHPKAAARVAKPAAARISRGGARRSKARR
jgi:3-dehydroquinate dehydratase II